MRVLFNGASTIRPKTGIGHTTLQLCQSLAELSPTDRFWLYPGNSARSLVSRFVKPSPRREGAAPAGKSSLTGPLRQLFLKAARWSYAAHFQATARFGRFDLYHEPNLVTFITHLPTVVTVHDLSVLLYPHWHPADRVKRFEHAFKRGVTAATHILVDSDAIRREAIAFLGLPPDRITTVHLGISSRYRLQTAAEIERVRSHLSLPQRYLLYVGTVEPRKNLKTLLRAYCDLPSQVRGSCPLILGGAWGWKSEPERSLFESEARSRGVRSLGYVADEDLPALYAGAVALLYPSHYEGFGLPPLEAMACGCPAIVSTAEAVTEVVGNQAVQIEAEDLDGWRLAMHRAIASPESLLHLRDPGVAHAAQFGWSRAARTTLGVYHRVLGIKSRAALESARAA